MNQLPKTVKSNSDNDLLYRNLGKTPEQIKKEQEEKLKLLKESVPECEALLEYFTE